MNIKKLHFFIFSLAICLGLSFSAFAQSNAQNDKIKAVKNLRKELVKNSRYQFQDLTILFHPIRFDTCDVTYRFVTTESIGDGSATSSKTASSPLDSYENTRNKPPVFVTNSQGNGSFIPGRNNKELNEVNEAERSRGFVETTLNLGNIDPASLEVQELSTGLFLAFKIADNKDLISKTFSNGQKPEPGRNEVFPTLSKKKAERLKKSFAEAIKQCQ